VAKKEIAVKKYVVKLSAEERERLEGLIRTGKSSAQMLTRARILLKADVSEAGKGWSDSAMPFEPVARGRASEAAKARARQPFRAGHAAAGRPYEREERPVFAEGGPVRRFFGLWSPAQYSGCPVRATAASARFTDYAC
jgi:hypothetical protein